jgi:hypothetical protein
MSFINEIFDFLRDKTLTFNKKSLIIVGIFILVFSIDWLFGISFNYSINQKINQIEKIENIKINYSLTDSLLGELNRLETKIINRIDYVKLVHFHDFKSKNQSTRAPVIIDTLKVKQDSTQILHKVRPTPTVTMNKPIHRNWIWDLITSTFIYMIVILFLIILPFTQKSDFFTTLLGSVIVIIAIGLVCWLSYWVFSNIPTIIKPWVNYIINSIVHVTIVVIIAYIYNTLTEKKK